MPTLTEQQQELYAKKARLKRFADSEDFAYWVSEVVDPYLQRMFRQIVTANPITEEGKAAAYAGIIAYREVEKLVKDAFEMNKRELEQMAMQLDS